MRLAHLKAPIMRDFIGQLKAGRMPLLSELDIRVDHYREKRGGEREAIADAGEARSRLGLPPLTRVGGVGSLPP